MATSSTVVSQVHQLAHRERCILDLLVVPVLPPASSSRQPLLGMVKGYPEPRLVFDHPIGYRARYWIGDFTQQKVDGKSRFLTEHQVERGLSCTLMECGVITK